MTTEYWKEKRPRKTAEGVMEAGDAFETRSLRRAQASFPRREVRAHATISMTNSRSDSGLEVEERD